MHTINVTGNGRKLNVILDNSTKPYISEDTLRGAFQLKNELPISLSVVIGDQKSYLSRKKENDQYVFILPDGWENFEFDLMWENNRGSSAVTPVEQSQSRKLAEYIKFVYYTRIVWKNDGIIEENEQVKSSCSPFYTTLLPGRYFVISTRHGPHKCLEENDEVNIYNSMHNPFKAKVILFHDEQDFVLFECFGRPCENPPIVGPIVAGRHYVMLGYAEVKQQVKTGEHITPCFVSGIIMSNQPNAVGHICGSSGGISGLSGGPVFDLTTHTLIGICVSTDDLEDRETTLGRFSSDMIGYCKEITVVRILPVHDVAVLIRSKNTPPKKPLKRRFVEREEKL